MQHAACTCILNVPVKYPFHYYVKSRANFGALGLGDYQGSGCDRLAATYIYLVRTYSQVWLSVQNVAFERCKIKGFVVAVYQSTILDMGIRRPKDGTKFTDFTLVTNLRTIGNVRTGTALSLGQVVLLRVHIILSYDTWRGGELYQPYLYFSAVLVCYQYDRRVVAQEPCDR